MAEWWVLELSLAVFCFGVLFYLHRRRFPSRPVYSTEQICRSFRLQREHLEAQWCDQIGKKRLPDYVPLENCSFENDVFFIRYFSSGKLVALVGVHFPFPHDELMIEKNPGLLCATAGFVFHEGRWGLHHEVYLNELPMEVISHHRGRVEPFPKSRSSSRRS